MESSDNSKMNKELLRIPTVEAQNVLNTSKSTEPVFNVKNIVFDKWVITELI